MASLTDLTERRMPKTDIHAAINAAGQTPKKNAALVATGGRDVHVLFTHLGVTNNSSAPFIGQLAAFAASKSFNTNPEAWQHWALEVDGICIELTRRNSDEIHKPKYLVKDYLTVDQWRQEQNGWLEIRRQRGGKTNKSLKEIKEIANEIWEDWGDDYGDDAYSPMKRNCQNFVDKILKRILIKSDDATDNTY